MSADIEKLAVYDDRIVQKAPVQYAVEQGALSLTNSPFSALSATASQHTFQVQVPSLNVFVDRAVEWSSQCFLQFSVAIADSQINNGQPVVLFGRDCALAPFPLHSLVQTMTATINDTTATTNTGDVLYEVLRLTDYKKNRAQRTCPTYLDTYASYNDSANTINNPIGDYSLAVDSGSVPNGAWWNVVFTDSTGAPLVGSGTSVDGLVYVNGVPVQSGSQSSYTIYVRFGSTEKLVLSPFVFADCHEWDTGLTNIQNIQFVMNMASPSQTNISGRVLRSTTAFGRTISGLSYNQSVQGSTPFRNSRVNVQFLTPSLSLPLPQKSVVPYWDFPRYIYAGSSSGVASGANFSVQSQTITLPQIPDLIIIYAKPTAYSATDADWYFPLAVDASSPLSVNFDNFSGLLSSQTAEQLYAMSFRNGLDMDYPQWAGLAKLVGKGSSASQGAGNVPATGGFLVLKPSQDITLSAGQAPSLVGNFTFQYNITLKNTSPSTITGYTLYTITANSGYFESIKGSSRIVRGVLTEADIISAPFTATRSGLNRMVGGKHVLHRLGNVFHRAKEFIGRHAEHLKGVAKAVKPMLPQGAQDAMSAVGLGRHKGLHHRLA